MEKRCSVAVVDREIAIGAAKIKIEFKLGLADSLIVATARHLDASLVTDDPDLKGLKDVIFLPGA